MRVFKTAYIEDWLRFFECFIQPLTDKINVPRENNRQEEIKLLTSQGIIPVDKDVEDHPENMSVKDDYNSCSLFNDVF